MASPTAIEARNVSFRYENGLSLTDVSFTLAQGELMTLIGANGSGKTTLLKILLGLMPPDTGSVQLFNAPLSSYAPRERARQIAYVSQQPVTSFPLSVFELVALGRYPHASRLGLSEADNLAIEEAMERTASKPLAARRFTSLSGGEQQKILIARALAQSARILLLDEPTLHLDLNYQLQTLGALKSLCAEKRIAVITVLHDLNLVSLFADKALLLHAGTVRAFGPVARVVAQTEIKDLWGVDIKALTDEETGVRYFVPRRPR
jgi:iron complex transport system ATP-binding protein